MKKTEKKVFIENLSEELKAANAVVLVDFSGLSVRAQQELKSRLKGVGARMLVSKNTLLKLAAQKAKLDNQTLTDEVLTGQTALVIADEDPVAPVSVLGAYAVEFNTPQMKAGIIEGAFQDSKELIILSKLPGKDALMGQVVAAIAAPMSGLVGTLEGNISKLLFILEQKTKQN